MFLSICIPSYNRFCHLQELLDSVLQAKSKEFDVVIVDNQSPTDIRKMIKCADERVQIIRRETGVAGPANVAMTLDYADGEFAMLCLDKDFIVGEKLDEFIVQLKKCENIACGYCKLNGTDAAGSFEISDAFVKNVFQCGHPSGMFFRTKLISKVTSKMNLTNPASPYYNNPFLVDMFYAKCLCSGMQARFNGELIKTETPEQAAKQKSYSFSAKDETLYFTPNNRIKQFFVFMLWAQELNLSKNTYRCIAEKLIKKTMLEVSLFYKFIMENDQLCMHHGIKTKRVSKREQWQQIERFTELLQKKGIEQIEKKELGLIIRKCRLKTLLKIVFKG